MQPPRLDLPSWGLVGESDLEGLVLERHGRSPPTVPATGTVFDKGLEDASQVAKRIDRLLEADDPFGSTSATTGAAQKKVTLPAADWS